MVKPSNTSLCDCETKQMTNFFYLGGGGGGGGVLAEEKSANIKK